MAENSEGFLPVFQLAPDGLDRGMFTALLKRFRLEGLPEEDLLEGGKRVADGTRYLEASDDGRFWYADDHRMWNPANIPDPERLPGNNAADEAARGLLEDLKLWPTSQPEWKLDCDVAVILRTCSAAAPRSGSGAGGRGPREDLDVYVGFRTNIEVTDPTTNEVIFAEAQGQGTKIGVVFGENSDVIGLNASWRSIIKRKLYKVQKPVAPAVREPETSLRSAVVIPDSYRLIYRRTMLQGQPHLCPYWLFEVRVDNGDRSFRSADVTTPAADFLADAVGHAETYRSRSVTPKPNPGTGANAIGVSWRTNGAPHANRDVGLVLAQAAKAGWDVRFAWRDEDAWEPDWSTDAARWVDSCELGYYTGHAAYYGWQLTPRIKEEFLTSQTIGPDDHGGTMWRSRLRWIIIAACGPLQDDYVYSPNDNVFEWAGAFDGFRLLMGFASTIAGFTGEGGRTLELARRGVPLARAWLRAAREAQPCQSDGGRGLGINRWAAVLAGEDDCSSALHDTMPAGTGRPAGPLTAKQLRAIWTPA